MDFPPPSLLLPIPPLFSQVPTGGNFWASPLSGGIREHDPAPSSAGLEDPSCQEEGRFSANVSPAASSAANGSPANISNLTSDRRTVNQPLAKSSVATIPCPSGPTGGKPAPASANPFLPTFPSYSSNARNVASAAPSAANGSNISNLGLCSYQPLAKKPRMEHPSSQGSSFNTSSDTSADQCEPLDLTNKSDDASAAKVADTSGVNITNNGGSILLKGWTSTGGHPGGHSRWIIGVKNSRKKLPWKFFQTTTNNFIGAQPFFSKSECRPVWLLKREKEVLCLDLKKKEVSPIYSKDIELKADVAASLDLGRIKKFNETQFEYSDGVIAATSLEDWIRESKKFFKQENEQKSIIVLPKGETLPDDFKKFQQLVSSPETDFNVGLIWRDKRHKSRHYKFISPEGFELHVAEEVKTHKRRYFGRCPSYPFVFYQLEEPENVSNDIRNILNEARMWVTKQRKVVGKTIAVADLNVSHFIGQREIANFPSIWHPKGHVILYGTIRGPLDEITTLNQWIKDENNVPTVTQETVTEEANRKLEQQCNYCVRFTVYLDQEYFELYYLSFPKNPYVYQYLRKMDQPHVFLMIPYEQEAEVERLVRSLVKFNVHHPSSTTLVSRARRSHLGKMTEKKTRESNYQGLVLVSMVSCLVFVSTYWALAKKEENAAATRGSHSRSK